MKKYLLLLFSLIFSLAVSAESGTCGYELSWTLEEGTLTISGKGLMSDFTWTNVPWYSSRSSISCVVIDEGVTTIGNYAFSSCNNLTSITIPSSLFKINNYAFEGCDNLSSVNITDLDKWCRIIFTSSDSNPLENAHSLFLNGVEIKDLVIPSGITTISDYAFIGCSGLTSVTIPNSVTSIGDCAFEDCTNLSTITIPDAVKSIGVATFRDCRNLTSVTMPSSVRSIGQSAFGGCYKLASITLPNLTKIERYLFENCSHLTSIIIPKSVTKIEEYAFSGCSGITSIIIPSSVTSIETGVLQYCSSLTSIVVDDSNPKYDSRDNCNAIIETKSNILLGGCQNSLIPNSVVRIEDYAFGRAKLKSIIIPNSVTSIGREAFWCCSSLESLTLSNSLTEIKDYTFYGCGSLTTLTIPNSIKTIENAAFMSCSGLTSVIIGSSVECIKTDAFVKCPDITTIYSLAEVPPTLEDHFAVFDSSIYDYATLYVPEAGDALAKYSAAKVWKKFSNIQELDMTGIRPIAGEKADSRSFYNLHGQHSVVPTRGINVANGHKVLVH